ncbi:hypothetical protein KEJ13_07550 [Candidatus Bathyarchaeota archaeon]|nr:hypothetical protein [Candidatus Bathyarchaeota archaeon]
MRRLVIFLGFFLVLSSVAKIIPSEAEALPYAYVIPVTSKNWVNATRFANTLLYAGVPVYWAQEKFTVEGTVYEAGSFIVPVTAPSIGWRTLTPEKADSMVKSTAKIFPGIPLVSAMREFNASILVLKPPRIAIHGDQVSHCFAFYGLVEALGFKADIVMSMDIRNGILDNYDVFMFPGDSLPQIYSLGYEGCKALERFIIKGGGLIASCAGTIATAGVAPNESWPEKYWLQVGRWYCANVNTSMPFGSWTDWRTPWVKEAPPPSYISGYYNPPGIGLIILKNENPKHPVMLGIPTTFTVVHWQGPMLKPVPVGYIMWPRILPNGTTVWEDQWFSNPIPLASFYDWTENFTFMEYYANVWAQKNATRDTLMKTLFGRGISEGLISIMGGYMGNGKVVVSGSHPELGTRPSLEFLGDEDIQAKIYANAIYWQVSEPSFNPVSFPISYGVSQVLSLRSDVERLVKDISKDFPSPPDRLVTPVTTRERSTFGMTPQDKWSWFLSDLSENCKEVADACTKLTNMMSMLQSKLDGLQSLEKRLLELRRRGFEVDRELEQVHSLREMVLANIRRVNEDINFLYVEEWTPPDGTPPRQYAGAEVRMGLLQLLNLTKTRLGIVLSALRGEIGWPGYLGSVDAALGGYGPDGFMIRCLAFLSGDTIDSQVTINSIDIAVNELTNLITSLEERKSIEDLSVEMAKMKNETTSEIAKVKDATTSEIAKVKDATTSEIAKVRDTITTAYYTSIATGIIGALIGAVVAYLALRKSIK